MGDQRRGPGPWLAVGLLGPLVAIVAAVLDVLLLAAVAVVVFPVVRAVWIRPQRGLLLLVALLPFDGLLLVVPLPGAASAWKEVLLGVTLVAALRTPSAATDDRVVPPWVVPLAALGTLAMLTTLWVPPLQAVVGLKVAFFGMLTAVVVWRAPLRGRDLDRLVTILAVTGVVVAVIGLGQQLVGHERLHELGYAYNSVIRFTSGFMRSWSTFNQPFPFAFYLMVVVLVTGSVALAEPRTLRNRALLAAMPVLLAGMGVAVVRAAWIGLVAGVITLAVTRYRQLLVGLPLAGGLAIVAVVLGVVGFFSSPSVGARFERWGQIPEVIISAPLGRGIGTAGAAAARTELLVGGEFTFDPGAVAAGRLVFQPDNTYLKVLYELGAPGLGVFALLLVAVFVSTRRAQQRPDIGDVAAGVSAVVVAAAVASLAATFFEIFPLDYLFWLLVAVVTCTSVRGPRATELALHREAAA